MSRRAAPPPPIEEVARVAERLAVLLAAGVSPVSAWEYLLPPGAADARPRSPLSRRRRERQLGERAQRDILTAAGRAARNGDSVADAIAAEAGQLPDQLGSAWRALAAAWEVATQAGAPLSGCLRDLASAFRELGQLHRDLAVALTGPRATARLVLVLPVVALLFGSLMGFDTLRTLFLTGPGLVCLAAGALLMLAAARWNRRLVRSAQAGGPAPGLELDLTAIGMTGGGSLEGARALARRSAERFGLRGPGPVGAGGRPGRREPGRVGTGKRLDPREPGPALPGEAATAFGRTHRSGFGAAEGSPFDSELDPVAGSAFGEPVGSPLTRSVASTRGAALPATPGTGPNAATDTIIDRVLDLSARAGVPAAELLRSEAEQLRRDARSDGRQRAETLAVTLMLPLGVCVLPAFMLVGVAPLLLSVLSSTLGSL